MAHIREDLSTGRRLYVQTASGEPVVDRLKAAGCHWDRDSKCWWVSAARRAEVEELLVGADQKVEAGEEPAQKPEDVSDARVYAQVEYRGRRYYVIAEQKSQATATLAPRPLRCRLTTLDGTAPFWVDCEACTLVRRYEGRERWDGRRYSGRTVTVYPTIGSLRSFRDSQRAGEQAGLPACAACGKRSAGLIRDLEDGCMKCPGCCDMPS